MTSKPLQALIATALLAGCAGQTVVTRVDQEAIYTPNLVRYVARDGTFPTVVRGQPYAGPQDEVERAVLSALRLPSEFGTARFITTADAQAGKGPRLVLTFNAQGGPSNARAVCAGRDAGQPAAPAAAMQVQASFCHGDAAVSQAHLAAPSPGGGAGLTRTLDQLMVNVFPVQERTVFGGCSPGDCS